MNAPGAKEKGRGGMEMAVKAEELRNEAAPTFICTRQRKNSVR